MSPITLTALPFDICDRVLTFLPDFLSLQSAVLSSRHLYETFVPRNRSITRSVGFNEVGRALSYAIALVRTERSLESLTLQDILQALNDVDPDSEFWMLDVTGAEAKVLQSVSSVVRRLESYFCIMYKDRTAPTSILTEDESFKFHRAICRIWILSFLVADNNPASNIPSKTDIALFTRMTEQELVEMHEALLFLDRLYTKMICAHHSFQGTFLSVRPYHTRPDELLAGLDGIKDVPSFRLRINQSGGRVSENFVSLLNTRGIAGLYEGKYGRVCILSSPRNESVQTCQKCTLQTPELYSENNWHLLHPNLTMHHIMASLPGKLAYSAQVVGLIDLLRPYSSFAPMISEMFDTQNDPDSGWSKKDWLCVECIKNFIKERIISWLVSQLVKAGHQFKPNCWYGWNCRTQTHKLEHAKKLNHLCEPTDRDDTNKNNTNSNNNHAVAPVGLEGDDEEEFQDPEDDDFVDDDEDEDDFDSDIEDEE